jgi:hypothetical protein
MATDDVCVCVCVGTTRGGRRREDGRGRRRAARCVYGHFQNGRRRPVVVQSRRQRQKTRVDSRATRRTRGGRGAYRYDDDGGGAGGVTSSDTAETTPRCARTVIDVHGFRTKSRNAFFVRRDGELHRLGGAYDTIWALP